MFTTVLLLFASQTGEGADQNTTKAIAHDLMTSFLTLHIEMRFPASFRLNHYLLNSSFFYSCSREDE